MYVLYMLISICETSWSNSFNITVGNSNMEMFLGYQLGACWFNIIMMND